MDIFTVITFIVIILFLTFFYYMARSPHFDKIDESTWIMWYTKWNGQRDYLYVYDIQTFKEIGLLLLWIICFIAVIIICRYLILSSITYFNIIGVIIAVTFGIATIKTDNFTCKWKND